MPLQNIRFTFDQVTGDPADRVVWSFGVDGPGITNSSLPAIATQFETALGTPVAPNGALQGFLQGGMELILAEAFPAEGGEATAVNVRAWEPVGASSGGPSEVQLVVSRMGMTPRGMAPIGRIYIGPLAGGATNMGGRPGQALINAAGSFCQDFHITRLATLGYVPVVIRFAGTPQAVGRQIDGHRVDNAWDTQRRRGWEPTATTAFPSS